MNTTQENNDGYRESWIDFRGEKLDGTKHTLGRIMSSQQGSSDNYDGILYFKTNTSSSGVDTLVEAMRLDSDSNATFAGNVTLTSKLQIGDNVYNDSTSYVGLAHINQTGASNTEYMIMSADADTYISASTGCDVHIRGGNNVQTYELRVYPDAHPTASGNLILTSDNYSSYANFGSTALTAGNGTFSGVLAVSTSGIAGSFTSSQSSGLIVQGGGNSQDIAKFSNTSGTEKFSIDSAGNSTFAGDLIVPEYIKHAGDTDTNIRFTDNTIGLYTAEKIALTLDSSQNATFEGYIGSSRCYSTASGSASNAAFAFEGDVGTGMYKNATNAVSFATGGVQRLKIGSSGKATFYDGIAFDSGETLDSYEEGSWTPAVNQSWTHSGNSTNNRYTRIGNVVHIWGHLDNLSNGSGTADLTITGLPFTVAHSAVGGDVMFKTVDFYNKANNISVYVNTSENLYFFESASTYTWTKVSTADLAGTADDIYFSLTYETDA
jgi:hypothetical protein